MLLSLLSASFLKADLTTDSNDRGPAIPIERRSRSRTTVSDDFNFRNNEEAKDQLYELIREVFKKSRISITEIQYWETVVVIVLEYEDENVLSAVPKSVAQCP